MHFYRLESVDEDLQERSRWNTFLEKALTTSPLDSRAFRAGVILNPLRGLTMEENDNTDDKITAEGKTLFSSRNFLLRSIKKALVHGSLNRFWGL